MDKFDPDSKTFDISDIPELTKDKLVSNPIKEKIEVKSVVPEILSPEQIYSKFSELAQETEKKEIAQMKSTISAPKIDLPKSTMANIAPISLDYLDKNIKLN